MKKRTKITLFLLTITLIIISQSSLTPYLSLDQIKINLQRLQDYFHLHPVSTLSTYFIVYMLMIAFSLPGAIPLTLAGGAIFGPLYGILLVSFASTLGASLAFAASRLFFKDYIQKRFAEQLVKINEGIKNNGTFYLLSLRLMPIFPHSLVNFSMALTPIKLRHFMLVSQIGTLPATILYTYAGLSLSQISSPKDIFTARILIILCLVGLLPLIALVFKKIKSKKIKLPSA